MNFLDLYKKIRQIDEQSVVDYRTTKNLNEGDSQGNLMPQAISAPPSHSLEECGMSECGDMPMPSHAPSAPPQQDSVSMSVNMSGSGKGGIRDLMDILRNIENKEEKEVPIGVDHDDSVVIDAPDHALSNIEAELETMAPVLPPPVEEVPEFEDEDELPMDDEFEDESLLDDGFENEPATLDQKQIMAAVASVINPPSDDLHSKGKEAPKQAGGGNPWNVSESAIAAKLSRHYEEVKSRNNVTEGYWGWDPPDEPDPYYGHGEGTIELDLPAPHDINLNSEDYDVTRGDVVPFNVSYDANGDDYEITSVVYYTGDYPDVQIDLNKVDSKWYDYVAEKMGDILEKRASRDSDDYDGGYDGGYDDSGWQDSQNRWERGIDSRY